MTLKRIDELRQWLTELRAQGQVPSRELERLAEAVGRVPHNRGKHPMYEMAGRLPLSIPHHSKPMNKFTKNQILTILEGDLGVQEELLTKEPRGNGNA
jgi:hypothetical protein